MRRTPTPWNLHVKKVWEDNKHKAGYKFKQALKDAAKLWKNGTKTKRNVKALEVSEEPMESAMVVTEKPKKKSVRKTRKAKHVIFEEEEAM